MYLPLLRIKLVQYCINLSFLCHNNRPSHLPFAIWILESKFAPTSPYSDYISIAVEELFFSEGTVSRRLLIWNMRQLFFLLFQPCYVYMYVAGNRRFRYFLYILMKYVVLFPNHLSRISNFLVEQSRNPVRFLINIYKLSSAVLRLSYILWNER